MRKALKARTLLFFQRKHRRLHSFGLNDTSIHYTRISTAMRCHMLMLNVPSSLLSRRQRPNVTHRKVWTVLTFYNVLTFKPIHIVCRFLKSPNPNQTSQLVLFPLLINNFYNKNVLSLLGSHSSETMHSIRQSSSFRNSRLNKKN